VDAIESLHVYVLRSSGVGMTHTDRLRKSADAFRRLTGITPAAFDRLLDELEPRYAADDARWW